MQFDVVLELVDRASAGLRNIQAAANASANTSNAAKAEAAMKGQATAAAAAAATTRGAAAAERTAKAELSIKGAATARLGTMQQTAMLAGRTEVSLGGQAKRQGRSQRRRNGHRPPRRRPARRPRSPLPFEQRARAVAQSLGAGDAFDKAVVSGVVRQLASNAVKEIMAAQHAVASVADAPGVAGAASNVRQPSAKAIADMARRDKLFREAEQSEGLRRNAARAPWWPAYWAARRSGAGTADGDGGSQGADPSARLAQRMEGARRAAEGFGTALGAALGMATKIAVTMGPSKQGWPARAYWRHRSLQ